MVTERMYGDVWSRVARVDRWVELLRFRDVMSLIGCVRARVCACVVSVCMCVHVCTCACVCMYVCVYVYVCVRVHGHLIEGFGFRPAAQSLGSRSV